MPDSSALRAARRRAMPWLAALAALACASPPAPRPQIAAQRIVVAPMNLGLRTSDELRASQDPVWNELLRYLRARHSQVSVLDAQDAAGLWRDALAELGRTDAPIAPSAASERFALRVREHVDYDLLVMPALVLRQARIGGTRAMWDGTRRKLPIEGARIPADLGGTPRSFSGNVAAASLYVTLLGPDGRTTFEGLAGLDVLQALVHRPRSNRASRWAVETRSDPFSNPEHLRAGVERAFERPLPQTARSH